MRHVLVAVLLSMTAPTAALACKCLFEEDDVKRSQANWDRATDIVVVKIKADDVMEVVEVLKGPLKPGHIAKQTATTTCDQRPREGTTWLVFSSGNELKARMCTGTHMLGGPDDAEVVELRKRKGR